MVNFVRMLHLSRHSFEKHVNLYHPMAYDFARLQEYFVQKEFGRNSDDVRQKRRLSLRIVLSQLEVQLAGSDREDPATALLLNQISSWVFSFEKTAYIGVAIRLVERALREDDRTGRF
jgi:hypothetical protein